MAEITNIPTQCDPGDTFLVEGVAHCETWTWTVKFNGVDLAGVTGDCNLGDFTLTGKCPKCEEGALNKIEVTVDDQNGPDLGSIQVNCDGAQ